MFSQHFQRGTHAAREELLSPQRQYRDIFVERATVHKFAGDLYPEVKRDDSITEELHLFLPQLSAGFQCSSDDAATIATAIIRSRSHMDSAGGSDICRLEEKVQQLECDLKVMSAKLERREDDGNKLRDEVGEARQKLRAMENSSRQQCSLLSQRREEVRKQLLCEESRTQKLTVQNKQLQQEVDRLKALLNNRK